MSQRFQKEVMDEERLFWETWKGMKELELTDLTFDEFMRKEDELREAIKDQCQ